MMISMFTVAVTFPMMINILTVVAVTCPVNSILTVAVTFLTIFHILTSVTVTSLPCMIQQISNCKIFLCKCRTSCKESCRGWTYSDALHQDKSVTRVRGCDILFEGKWCHPLPDSIGLWYCWLWMHDMYRKQWSSAWKYGWSHWKGKEDCFIFHEDCSDAAPCIYTEKLQGINTSFKHLRSFLFFFSSIFSDIYCHI